ncbi:acylneuraminate cytidylyltransferase [Geothermobacter hydrogeniphilus]|uniref:Acylneuraminate cytidylyltransferase n=1 Tax=Geothermobacter hydrogeniphilus TaxID=1969733 RepID=A0A2K2HCY8_9BACT|nr:glycosyltransferase family protein [Geothermobacter hydrogeniphilus]PNU21156.1 acylneuraminate cytidylyltransferase [Geothermobacter hydrogeniphilus]
MLPAAEPHPLPVAALPVGGSERLGVIIQARMGSTRLPGKVLKPVGDRPLLGVILRRLERLQSPAEIIVATSELQRDDPVATFCLQTGVRCFRGSEEDVLDRYYHCATGYRFSQVVRLTADNPFVDVAELDRLIRRHLASQADYSHSFASLPVGVGAEIFSYQALEESFNHGHLPHHREHVNEFIQERPGRFRIATLNAAPGKHRPDIRLTVDTPEDYRRACFITANRPAETVTTREAIDLCELFAERAAETTPSGLP